MRDSRGLPTLLHYLSQLPHPRSAPTSHGIDIKVRGYHLDLFRHVNNARYLEFLEEARWSFLESQGPLDLLEARGYTFAVVNININYRRAAFMGEIPQVATSVKSIGACGCVMHQSITLKGADTAIADADVTFVIVDTRTEKAATLEGELRTVLEQLAE
jgi:thioesterase-3